ncbi:MAG: D-alanyl-D-alanine carboxypeptidase [Clostridia bacterium]|nr:D-alanyl-D-alanine carboxypeptidase [Clostridia bacterium]
MNHARRWACLLLALLLAALMLPAQAAKPKVTATPDPNPKPTLPRDVVPYNTDKPEELLPEQLYAWSAILIEAKSGEVIFEKNADDIRYPASTTKIMTCLLALLMLDEEQLNSDVFCTEQAVAVNTQEEDVTSLKLKAGDSVNLLELIEATLVYSANDGANVIAEAVGGTIPNFVNLMNETAVLYGCTNTHFANAHGLHDDAHYTTPRDLAIIARVAMQNERFREIVKKQSVTITITGIDGKSRTKTVNTTNDLFKPGTEEKPNKYYFPAIQGVKTGFTGKAQYCFVGDAIRDDVELISVVMYSGDNSRWADTIKLMNYGFAKYKSVTPIDLYNMNPITIETSNYSLQDSQFGKLRLQCVATDAVGRITRITALSTQIEAMARNLRTTMLIQYTRDFIAPIEAGEVIGTMTYVPENGETAVYELVATRSVAKRENAPPTLSEIIAASDADPNPFPPLSFEVVLLLMLPLAGAMGLILLLRYLIIGRRRSRKNPKIRHRYLR